MKSQFGDALGKIQEAENEVKSAKDDLKKAQGVVDQLNQDIDHASPWNKISLVSCNPTGAILTSLRFC